MKTLSIVKQSHVILFWRAYDNSEQFPQETYLWNQNHLLFYITNTEKYLETQIVRAAFNMKTLLVRVSWSLQP